MIIPESKPDEAQSNAQPPSYYPSGQPPPAGGSQPVYQSPSPPQQPVYGSTFMPTTGQDNHAAERGQQYHQQLLARCAQGSHTPSRRFGVFGIIMAIVLFPIGLICLAVDSERHCKRCGIQLD